VGERGVVSVASYVSAHPPPSLPPLSPHSSAERGSQGSGMVWYHVSVPCRASVH
jgi:hypothetical protein